jgi:hypothetical protein
MKMLIYIEINIVVKITHYLINLVILDYLLMFHLYTKIRVVADK